MNRNFEPLRGFNVFMRALPALLEAVPEAHVVLIGNKGQRGYGGEAGEGRSWTERMIAEVGDRLDLSRVHFLGKVPHDVMLDAISIGGGARLLHLSIRALLVAAGGDGVRGAGDRLRHEAAA